MFGRTGYQESLNQKMLKRINQILRVQLLNLSSSSSSSSLLSASSSFLPLNSLTGVDDPSQLRTKIVRIVNFTYSIIIMSMSNSLKKLSSCVLIDLDGTLINTGIYIYIYILVFSFYYRNFEIQFD